MFSVCIAERSLNSITEQAKTSSIITNIIIQIKQPILDPYSEAKSTSRTLKGHPFDVTRKLSLGQHYG